MFEVILHSLCVIYQHHGMFLQMMLQLVHSSWILHVSCNKRRVAPIAALLSSILHYSVFTDLNMHVTINGEKGPLKWVSDTYSSSSLF